MLPLTYTHTYNLYLYQVKVLYVRNLTTSVSEEGLRERFEEHGRVERVKKIKDYAFVHFEERKQAIQAMQVGGARLALFNS